MKKIVINGGRPLKGEVTINGAKNTRNKKDNIPRIPKVKQAILKAFCLAFTYPNSEYSLTILLTAKGIPAVDKLKNIV